MRETATGAVFEGYAGFPAGLAGDALERLR